MNLYNALWFEPVAILKTKIEEYRVFCLHHLSGNLKNPGISLSTGVEAPLFKKIIKEKISYSAKKENTCYAEATTCDSLLNILLFKQGSELLEMGYSSL